MNLQDVRREYALKGINKTDLAASPFVQFQSWYDEFSQTNPLDATAMVLATSNQSSEITQRIVLLKSFDENGFVFFSNYQSRKGQDIEQNPGVSLLFAWHAIDRQIIIQGQAKKISAEQSREYFESRPRNSQIAAAVSQQSQVVASREQLEQDYQQQETLLKDKPIPKPEHWGGYCVEPQSFEFWQGRVSRLHDRLVYRKKDQQWAVTRLSP